MPKGSFGSFKSSSPRSSSKSYSYSSPKSPVPSPSSYSSPSPAVQHHNVKVEQPGFFSNMLQGFGLGAGQSMAFNLFRSSPSVSHSQANTSGNSVTTITPNTVKDIPFPKEYIQCMKETKNDSEQCKQYLEKDTIKQL